MKLSILIPHRHTPENDKALALALDCIVHNTRADYELLVDTTTPADPYVVVNRLAAQARGEYIFLSNSDIFVSPGWDVDLLDKAAPDVIVNATLVEPGAIGVFTGNFTRDFGMTPDSFRRAEFEAWAAAPDGAYPDGNGFVFVGLLHRETFLSRGGFDTTRGHFPDQPLDSYYWQAWEEDGKAIVRSKSLVYHLQHYSNEFEQDKDVRHGR